jgi:hypothetical protein
VSLLRFDYDVLTGMLGASPVALSWNVRAGISAANPTMGQLESLQRPSCFRSLRQPSAPLLGVRLGRKLGPEDKSHKSLSSAVCADRNVD